MRKIEIFFLILLIISCDSKFKRTVKRKKAIKKQNIVQQKVKTVIKKQNIVQKKVKSVKRINTPKKRIVVVDNFNGVIEDFEKSLKYWQYTSKNNGIFNKIPLHSGNIGEFEFNAPYSREEFHPHINYIMYMRKMDFSKYNGIKFIAKGAPTILYKIKIMEKEVFYSGYDVKEVWYKIFRVNNAWKKYRIFFKDMQVEEYYEQDYVSDNIQVFTNVIGISITAQNMSTRGLIKGEIYIDDIELF